MTSPATPTFSMVMLAQSLPDAVRKLNPVTLVRNPVMFVVEIGSVLTTVFAIASRHKGSARYFSYHLSEKPPGGKTMKRSGVTEMLADRRIGATRYANTPPR